MGQSEPPVNVIMRKIEAICNGSGYCVDAHIKAILAFRSEHSSEDLIEALAGVLWVALERRRNCESLLRGEFDEPAVACALEGARKPLLCESGAGVYCYRCRRFVIVWQRTVEPRSGTP